jgi:hypothetical protein
VSGASEHKGFPLGLFDKRGIQIRCGDLLLHMNESPNTKPEYWYGLYRVTWLTPCFVAVHIGGGKKSDVSFTLRHYPQEFLIVAETQ